LNSLKCEKSSDWFFTREKRYNVFVFACSVFAPLLSVFYITWIICFNDSLLALSGRRVWVVIILLSILLFRFYRKAVKGLEFFIEN
jgi:hypothetical protein